MSGNDHHHATTPGTTGKPAIREGAYPVRWSADQATVVLPEHIEISNAGLIREDLLLVINRGAATLIVDMTATVSCDHAGADAVARAFQRATASGTVLRLAVTARIVRRVLSLSGLDRMVAIYPSLEAAEAASAPALTITDDLVPPQRGRRPPAAEAQPASAVVREYEILLEAVLASLFRAGLTLQSALDLPADLTRQHIVETAGCLDETVREIRGLAFTHGAPPDATQERP